MFLKTLREGDLFICLRFPWLLLAFCVPSWSGLVFCFGLFWFFFFFFSSLEMALASLLILHEERLKSQSGALHAGGWAESSAQGFPNTGLCRSFPLSGPVSQGPCLWGRGLGICILRRGWCPRVQCVDVPSTLQSRAVRVSDLSCLGRLLH